MRFVGNVAVGRDLPFDAVAEAFDIVVLATGLPDDRALPIPTHAGARIIGAGALLRTLNGFPESLLPVDGQGRHMSLGDEVAVIGFGNVALDVIRLLSKNDAALHGSDVSDVALNQLRPKPPRKIHVFSRSAPDGVKCELTMLRELLSLRTIRVSAEGIDLSDATPVTDLLRQHIGVADSGMESADARTHVRLHFGRTPESVESRGPTTTVTVSTVNGGRHSYMVDCVITAIGFDKAAEHIPGNPTSEWAGPHVYRVGWLRRGPVGSIPENRKDARDVAGTITRDLASGAVPVGSPGFAVVEPLIRNRMVSFADWQRIEKTENQSAEPGRCRRKLIDLEQMLEIAASRDATMLDRSAAEDIYTTDTVGESDRRVSA
ncbi:oxidoreductase [Gordonia aquimaris]|uniref:Oxidoreductase n=1 Tax=Gordonia aquimaris TaxID=2984863 RepID=A0A9X3D449_9ACTN|nr:oxidoreductase [Gordonia aquimaris]MCX2963187.1 oxidoreductase [Gordonia aquimaris]